MLSNNLWKSLLVTPALLSATIVASSSAIAAETQPASASLLSDLETTLDLGTSADITTDISEIIASETAVEFADAAPSVSTLDQLNQYSSEGRGESLSQVTSVSQLSDVQPTDWAFQALQSLVERYGCIAGYPDGTYRGNRAMTRYEFAAGLNACLDRVNELIAAGLADKVSREDLAVLQRLQEEFAAELATLRGRVDALEARVAELEANQFSTTTKLNGEVIFAQEAAITEDDIFDNQVTFGYRVRLNFDTSFTGEDRLRTRLQARDLPDFDNDPIGRSFSGGGDGNFVLDDLVYTFPLGPAEIVIGANSIGCDDFVASTISPLDSSGSGSISNFGFPPQYSIACDGDAGAGALVQLTDFLSLDFGYSAYNDPENPDEGQGLFNGSYGAIVQLTALGLFDGLLDAALTYVNAYDDTADAFGIAGPTVANTYGGQFNFRINDTFEIGGGIAFADIESISALPGFDVWSYQATLAINDLFGEGNQLGILAGVTPYTADLGNDDTSILVEGYYRYQLNDNIAITPSIVWIEDPFNVDLDSTVNFNLRTTFDF
ncbi:MAG: iron uptake porin [Synechococcales bacterium]|nr:iron uptake porin [Synechococcales bacterium]